MSELMSERILSRLKSEAGETGRPEQRLATLERLVCACDAVADGSALLAVQRGNPEAEMHFRRRWVSIVPPRIEEYVIARRVLDQADGRRSQWTGPVASSLRKEGEGMLAYVRARELERHGKWEGRVADRTHHWWQVLDGVSDEKVRVQLMRALVEGGEAKKQVSALKRAVLLCSPTFDIDAYLRGQEQHVVGHPELAAAGVATLVEQPIDMAAQNSLTGLLERLRNNKLLASFELEYDGARVRQRVTKEALVSATELTAVEMLCRSTRKV